ncbi:bifunctional folylpolyglutamate synthase/dihydrofolate synthase [Prosthecochloris sp. SCSIO W1103]|uniref:bifunctional folylpolyglutamate synthase/dihydrofolate synthase n=1 Tax=Prosthecochloris sp. SCSIO W1103 TaxID=2992244 RepID=UPI00223E1A03|nr:folylpolyglutamate synthase/dihydrofolate synthase family protein [Prosthecochloris sp. SCSIO W1103]UZJ37270.1 bifunctional folylpolyglutamate synthase/dihydrofolate synthase [Prosthecochloris sp. SCSIO W1103]
MKYQDAIDFLFPLHRFGMKPGLERVLKLLHAAGEPQKRLGRVVHIAGTNGKGAVASSLAAICCAGGYSTGLYTSPHLLSYTERIRVNGDMISESQIAEYCSVLKDDITEGNATFFEATTAIAFMYFCAMQVDVSVIETGMGGRLDATNVVEPDHVIIPSISEDHTSWLGETISEIATEKAAIIKKGASVYTAVEEPEALKVILDRADAVGAKVRLLKESAECVVHGAGVGRLEFSLKAPGLNMRNLVAPVTGDFHASNLSLSVLAASEAGIDEPAIRQGLLSMQRFGYRARLERLSKQPDVLLDVSHNPAGIEKSVQTLCAMRGAYRNIIVLLGLVHDKEAGKIVRYLKRLTSDVITVDLLTERGMTAIELGDLCRDEGLQVTVTASVREALGAVDCKAEKDDLVLITGSFYLAGEVLGVLGY